MRPGRSGPALALLLSLSIHALLLSLVFGGVAIGVPGFGFPWQDRRIEVRDRRLVLVAPRIAAIAPAVTTLEEPPPQAWAAPPVAAGPAPAPRVSPAPTPERTAAANMPAANPSAQADSATEVAAVRATTPARADPPGDPAPAPRPRQAVIALERHEESTWAVPATPPVPAPAVAAAPGASSPQAEVTPPPREAGGEVQAQVERDDQEARKRALELAELDRARQEALRQAQQQEAARQAAQQQEAARQAAQQQEAARRAVQQLEAARQEAARAETTRLEAERQEAARQEAAKVEAARQDAARQDAARQEAARQESARAESARIAAAQDAQARREATLRAIGRQLDEEAARRDAASAAARQSPSLAPSSSSARRGRLVGRTDSNAELIAYADATSRKIQLNMTFEMVREAARQRHSDPLVTVAVRSDGSVESVTFVRSSGVAALDEAIQRVVHSQAPYPAFSPGLAREFDVIEIRRSWHFDMAIRLY